jgi:hypothetical protein
MNLRGLLPTTDRHLHRCILLTFILACLLIAATLWIYQKRIQRLRQKLNEGAAPAVSITDGATLHRALNHIAFIRPTMQATGIAPGANQSAEH